MIYYCMRGLALAYSAKVLAVTLLCQVLSPYCLIRVTLSVMLKHAQSKAVKCKCCGQAVVWDASASDHARCASL